MIWSLVIFLSPGPARAEIYDAYSGETITYKVKSVGLSAATAKVRFNGAVDLDGKKAFRITFKATSVNFLDVEEIYADPETLYPLKVVRDLNIWGSKEKITEEYDQEKFTVVVTKVVPGKPEPEITTITKKAKIDNLYCFIYRFRQQPAPAVGQSFHMNLPTKDVAVRVVKTTKIKALGKSREAYFLQTDSKDYAIWFSTEASRLAFRIDKGSGIGGTSMVMTEYENTR